MSLLLLATFLVAAAVTLGLHVRARLSRIDETPVDGKHRAPGLPRVL